MTQSTYLWCGHCRRSFRHDDAPDGICPVCSRPVKPIGKFNAILRGLMANELSPSPLVSKHRQMIRLMWTHDGLGEQYYRTVAPEMPYNQFESTVTSILCRGAEMGHIRFVIPPAPTDDESAYRMEVINETWFMTELEKLAGPDAAVPEGAS